MSAVINVADRHVTRSGTPETAGLSPLGSGCGLSSTYIRKNKVDISRFYAWGLVEEGLLSHPDPLSPPPLFALHYNLGAPMCDKQIHARQCIFPCATKAAVVPVSSRENDEACVQGRILNVRNKNRFCGNLTRRSREFVEDIWIALGKPKLQPWHADQVFEHMPRQDRAQKIFRTLQDQDPQDGILRTFQKIEAYGEAKAPRNISAVGDQLLLETCKFVYPVDSLLKKHGFGWYAPGKNPDEIGEQIAKITKDKKYFASDYSKFDGHQTAQMRWIAGRLVERCFSESDADAWHAAFEKELQIDAMTAHGVRYNAEGSMLSGSAITTLGNTLLNAFIFYMAIAKAGVRRLRRLDQMEKCIVVYGDDSLCKSVYKKEFFETCAQMGLAVTTEDTDFGAPFLGRIYYRDGDPNSMFDPRRLIPKIHIITASHDVSLAQAACNKAHGLKALCPGELLIESIADCILRIYGNLEEDKKLWSSEERFKEIFRNKKRLPPEDTNVYLELTALMLGLGEKHESPDGPYVDTGALLGIIEQYKDDTEPLPCEWYQNGTHFGEGVFMYDPYRDCIVQLYSFEKSIEMARAQFARQKKIKKYVVK